VTLILEYPDPRGPWGARGVGEVSIMAVAPAITAAVHAATGVWFDQFPLTPERVLVGIGKLSEQPAVTHPPGSVPAQQTECCRSGCRG